MSRRERHSRDSESRRHRSGFEREPSPKRSRRDGKPETERVPSNTKLNFEDNTTDRDQKHRRPLQDALPLKPPVSKVEPGALTKDSDKKPNGHHEGTKRSSHPTDAPHSRSYYQHDERGNAAQVDRSFGRRATTERRWRDSKDDQNERGMNKSSNNGSQQRDGRPQAKGVDNSVWNHDDFFKIEAEPAAPVRKRPAFREKKVLIASENTEKAAIEPVKPSYSDRPVSETARREERDRIPRHSGRSARPESGERKEPQRGGLWGRYGIGGGNYKERERFSGRESYRPGGTRSEKWKHDMYDEANKSPRTKNEEDQIAKVEALLAS